MKCKTLKRVIKDLVFENAALCDQIALIQDKELIIKEERKFLLKKYQNYLNMVSEPESQQIQSPSSLTSTHTSPSFNSDNAPPKKILTKKKMNSESPEGVKTSKHRRSYSFSKSKKLVQPIPLDISGRPVFPIILGGPTVHSLGEVVSDRPGYHTQDYIFPVGFCSTRIYGSLRDPERKCVYTCKVMDGGMSPSFEIVADNELDAPLVAKSASECHSMLLRHINNAVGYDVVNTKGRGPEFFGLSHPTIQNLIQSCPGTRKCTLYKWSKFEVSRSAELPVEENDASLNFEALQRSIAFYKLYMHMLREEQPSEPVTRENNLRDLLMA